MSNERVAVVTGAAQGVGLVTAATLAERGYRTILTDIQNLDNMMANYFTTIRNDNHDATNATTKLDASPINFLPTYYFFPVPLAAVTNNPNLKQNNNWGGSFDPLQ